LDRPEAGVQIDQVRAFVRCAELGSLSAAARVERVPKSTLSRLLRELEAFLQVRLLERSTRGVLLTDEGRMFLGPARRLLEDIQSAAALVRANAAAPAGVIRMTAPYTFGVTFLAPLLPLFLRTHPDIDLQLELTSRNLDLAEQGYDLAIRIGVPPDGYVARPLMRNPIMLCARPDYLAKRGTPETAQDLDRHDLLLIGSPRAASGLKLSKDGQTVRVTVPPRLLSNDPAVIKMATQAGAGIGQVPRILLDREMTAGHVVPVLTDWAMDDVDICIIYPAGRPLPPRIRAFITFLQAGLSVPATPVGSLATDDGR
jgi:DNA-binding transcriptional LysR family regulator